MESLTPLNLNFLDELFLLDFNMQMTSVIIGQSLTNFSHCYSSRLVILVNSKYVNVVDHMLMSLLFWHRYNDDF